MTSCRHISSGQWLQEVRCMMAKLIERSQWLASQCTRDLVKSSMVAVNLFHRSSVVCFLPLHWTLTLRQGSLLKNRKAISATSTTFETVRIATGEIMPRDKSERYDEETFDSLISALLYRNSHCWSAISGLTLLFIFCNSQQHKVV